MENKLKIFQSSSINSQFSILNSQFKRIPCFILAGGKSSRFGSKKDDKAFLFYKFQYEKCKKIFKNIYFAAKYKKFKNYPFFIEKSNIYAPLPVLEEIIKKHKKVFVLSVDTPNISIKNIQKLIFKKAVASDNPLIGYYDYTMLKKIRKNLQTNMRIFNINTRKLTIKENELVNINTTEDIKLLKDGL